MIPVGGTYPVSLVVDGRKVLVVGGGRIALRKATALQGSGAVVHVVAPSVSDELARLAEGRVARREFEPADLDGCWLAVEATGDPDVARAVADAADERRVWLNAADQPAACSVVLPAVLRRGAVTIAYSTDGTSPTLAAWLRDRAREQYGDELGVLADMLGAARAELHAAGRSTEQLDWRGLLDSGILEEIRRGRIVEAKERLQAWLSSSSE